MAEADTLYHYCGAEAFVSIVRNRTLWLSSLRLSNDTMEGRLVNETVMRLAARDGLSDKFQENLKRSVELLERLFDGLGFCLSEEGDLLSQWRGYADDGRGVSVGFSRSYLRSLAHTLASEDKASFSIVKVQYETHVHDALVEPTYKELRKLIDAGAYKVRGLRMLMDQRSAEEVAKEDAQIEKAHEALIVRLLELFPRLYELKTPAFREEREWRLVSIYADNTELGCEYRSARGRVIPYRSFNLTALDSSPISEVVIGPRHETPPDVIKSFLRQAGFPQTTVRRSDATYR